MISDLVGRRGSGLIGLTQKTKLLVAIHLDDAQDDAFVPSYTTLDKIEGSVSITAPNDRKFGDFHILFEGLSKTYVDIIPTTPSARNKIEGRHSFLKLSQPIDATDMPSNRTFKAGRTYTFPFTFVVPERLLPQSCKHPCLNEHVPNAHLALPPSLGDPLVASNGTTLLNDLAPNMSKVDYRIRVMIYRPQEGATKASTLVDDIKKLRIIPSSEEQPPVKAPEGKDHIYTWRKEQGIRKGLFKGKLGRLIVEAAQPKSLRLPSVRSGSLCPVTTMAFINLRFDPSFEDAQPPRLGCLVSKLKVFTFFAAVPFQEIPVPSTTFSYDSTRGQWSDSVPLSCRNVESVSWTSHHASVPPSQQVQHNPTFAVSQSGIPYCSEHSRTKVFYTCEILVPLSLPTNDKAFVPTFCSCIVARSYVLDLTLSVHTTGTTITTPTITLKIPLQITAEGNANALPIISQAEALAIAAREAHDELLPRSVVPPSPEHTERAEIIGGRDDHQVHPLQNDLPSPEYMERAELVTADERHSDRANPPDYTALGFRRRSA